MITNQRKPGAICANLDRPCPIGTSRAEWDQPVPIRVNVGPNGTTLDLPGGHFGPTRANQGQLESIGANLGETGIPQLLCLLEHVIKGL